MSPFTIPPCDKKFLPFRIAKRGEWRSALMRLLRIVHLHMGGSSSCIWQKRMQQCGPGVSDLEIEDVLAIDRNEFANRALNILSWSWLSNLLRRQLSLTTRVSAPRSKSPEQRKQHHTSGVGMGEVGSTYLHLLDNMRLVLGTNTCCWRANRPHGRERSYGVSELVVFFMQKQDTSM